MNNYNFELSNIANQLANLVQIVDEPNSISDDLQDLKDELCELNTNIENLTDAITQGFTQLVEKSVEK